MSWTELKRLMVIEHADVGMVVEAMRSLMKLVQTKGKSPGELGERDEELAVMAFPEVSGNATIQAQLANLYVEAFQNECIRYNMIKEAPFKLLAAITLAKGSQRIWEKVEGKGTQTQGWEVGMWGKEL